MNLKTITGFVLAGLLIAGIALFVGQSGQMEEAAAPQSTPPAAVADAAPPRRIDFSLPDLDGNSRKLSEWDDKARLVNFWATWCAPCRREIPLLKRTQAAHGTGNFQVIGIAVDDLEPVLNYAEEAQFNYPILVGQEDAINAAAASGIEFIGMPFTLIVAPGGELLATHIGEILESHIELIVDVFGQLEAGAMDLAAARAALAAL